MKNEAVLKQQLMQTEFDMQMQLRGMETQSLKQREDEKEKAKDKRISIQNTQQSKLIEQRKNNLPPVDFESNEDSLDGFDLAEFEPR
jgi:adenylate kinase family enzyme